VGLENYWDLWISPEKVAVISIRGTTRETVSWLANFYAAMVPAEGELLLTPADTFRYRLATHPKAAVHVGWLVATAYLSSDILPRIDSLVAEGVRDIILTGHSQGGAISFLLNAYLYDLQEQGRIPREVRFKTYSSAAPKPGNLYFAYEYEWRHQGGWAFNAVNSADWVPETPISIQTLNDFNDTNPFKSASEGISQQKFPTRAALRHVYNRLYKPSLKAQKNYEKYLGTLMSKQIEKTLPEFQPPDYYESNHYVRTGPTVILWADEAYFGIYPEETDSVFMHHLTGPYLYLLEKQFME
jgi:hypothetical protein